MSTRFLRTVTLAVLAACSTMAIADTPTRVGRIAMSQGQVGISGEQGEETNAALVNWPVTSRNQVTTGRDGRTEIRIGSTAVRLDADSALDVTELEDDSLRLHLHFGSASIRVRNAEVLRGFELSTPQGTIRLQEPGQFRVDAGRRQDTTVVSVFSGIADVDGGGSRLTLRAGKRAEIRNDDVYTGVALRDNFDEWSQLRDLRDERSESVRYTTSEMTGYEDLDQHGVWRDDSEYGPLWSPRNVPYGWAPYRDGRWTYLQPWGWTWVDNASWGYAPFHYGRWVMVNQRWCWTPGRNISRAIWSPALVGWVGGNNWNANFGSGNSRRVAPATGWYPLAPRDAYVPNYRMNHDNLRYLNRNAGAAQPDIRGRAPQRRDDQPRAGLTVVGNDQFRQRGTVVVPTAPKGSISPAQFFTNSGTPAVPPAPQASERERGRDWRRLERPAQQVSGERSAGAPTAIVIPSPQPGASVPRRVGSYTNDGRNNDGRSNDMRSDARNEGRSDVRNDMRRQRMVTPDGATAQVVPVQPSAPAPAVLLRVPSAPATPATVLSVPSAPATPAVQEPTREERVNRFRRADVERDREPERERRPRGAETFQQQVQAQQQQQMQQAQQQIQQQAQQQQGQLRIQQMQQMQQRQAEQQIVQQQQQMQQQQQRAQQVQQAQQAQQQQQQAPRASPVAMPQAPQQVATPRNSNNDGMRESRRRAREDATDMR